MVNKCFRSILNISSGPTGLSNLFNLFKSQIKSNYFPFILLYRLVHFAHKRLSLHHQSNDLYHLAKQKPRNKWPFSHPAHKHVHKNIKNNINNRHQTQTIYTWLMTFFLFWSFLCFERNTTAKIILFSESHQRQQYKCEKRQTKKKKTSF